MPVSDKPRKRYKPRLYDITFPEGHEWEDVEAKVKGASVDTLVNLMAVADLAAEVADAAATTITPGHREAVATMIREFSQLITWWNVDDEEGNPVEPDEAGVRSQDFSMVMALFGTWMSRYQVTPPLPGGSGDGRSPAELGSIPTETLPASQGS